MSDLTDSGCRPCCSLPHGYYSILVAVVASLAWAFSFNAVTNCHFLTPNYLYCHPPPDPEPKYGTCGDCHCILNGNETCPTGKDVPLVGLPDDWLAQLQTMDATNPYQMTCNPYIQTGNYLNCTSPPLVEYQIDLWETAVCGHVYDMDTLDEKQCPTQYEMVTYDSKEELEAAGAGMTHWGACGACSTSKDFAVYLEYSDLTAKGQECSIRGLEKFGGNFSEGVKCFQEVGYTFACATMWMYNVLNTKDNCLDVCVDFTFDADSVNNGPAPECKIANCLLCDETMSGPYFQAVAARSRRRTGLLSKIARKCDVILIVDHQNPCNVTQSRILKESDGGRDLLGGPSSTRITAPPRFKEPTPTATCVYITTDLGLTASQGTGTNNWLLPEFLLSSDEKLELSNYEVCIRYDFNGAISGFWRRQRDIFGPGYNAAHTFGVLALIFGIVVVVCLWCTLCVASGHRFWTSMFGLCIACGIFMLFTLFFFTSDVCENGCELGPAAIYAIVSSLVWWFAAALAHKSKPLNKAIPKAACCCCPTVKSSPYEVVPTNEDDDDDELVEVEIEELKKEDGEVVVQKTTTYPSGKKVIERTKHKSHSLAEQAFVSLSDEGLTSVETAK